MKRLLTLISLALITADLSWGGDESGHGGDSYAAEFTSVAREAVRKLRPVNESDLSPLDLETLEMVIKETEVYSEEHLFLNGQEVDAINYPHKHLIRINRTRWKALRNEGTRIGRYNLALHEYLGILGIDDSQYQVSHRLIAYIKPEPPTSGTNADPFSFPMAPFFTIAGEMGMGMYTGALGHSSSSVLNKGVRISYSTSSAFAFDLSVAHGASTDSFSVDGANTQKISTRVIPLTLGGRYNFVSDALPIIPYATFGGGLYFHKQVIPEIYYWINGKTAPSDEFSQAKLGLYAGLGSRISVIREALHVGLDVKFNQLFLSGPGSSSYISILLPGNTGYTGGLFVTSFMIEYLI